MIQTVRARLGTHLNWRLAKIGVALACGSVVCASGTPAFAQHATITATVQHATVAAIATDRAGNIYATGTTGSKLFITTENALKWVCDAGGDLCYSDAFVVKLDPFGRLLYSTYLGGSSNETGNAIAIDQAGNIYIGGTTWSADFPLQKSIVAPRSAQQGFITKLLPDGRLVFSTIVGGEGVTGVAVDASGAVCVTGFAYSDSVPMVNAIQPIIRRPPDAFIAKLKADGSAFVFSTYLGGGDSDVASAIALDPQGNVIVVGRTASADFPAVRAAQPCHGGGFDDAFIAKLAVDGSFLIFSTLLGGRDVDVATAVAVDETGVIYVTGATQSPDFPVTDNALDRTCGDDGKCDPHQIVVHGFPATVPYLDGFVAAFDQYGEWRFSTFLGGGAYDEGRAIAIDPSGRVSVAGFSTSRDFASNDDLICETDLRCPPFIVKLDRDGSTLLSAARFPAAADYAPMFDTVAMAVDTRGTLLLATNRQSTVTVGRIGPTNTNLPPLDSPCNEFPVKKSRANTARPAARSCDSGFSQAR